MGTYRTNKSYVDGVAAFINNEVHNLQKMGNLDLPFHLFRNGIDLSYTNWTRHGEKDEPSISAPEPVNATTEFVDDTDFALDIPTDGPATVEMVNAIKDKFDENDLVIGTNVIITSLLSRKVTPLLDTMLIQHQSEVGDSLEMAASTASSLEAEHVSGSGLRRQNTMGDTIARTRFKNVSKTSYDSPLKGVNTPQSNEDSMQHKELMDMCTSLLQRVQDLETTTTAQAKEIISMKKRVKKLEQRGRTRTLGLKRLYKVGTSRRVESSTEASLGIQGRFDDEDMFDTSVFNNEEVFAGQDMADQEVNVAEKEVSAADPVTTAGEVVTTASVDISTTSVPITISTATPTTTTEDDMTLAETLMEIKSAKPKAI
ncbi:hypothetical protein Tco_1284785 [Tanacetum coccineum]